jgi:TPR repeat protein
MFPNLNFSNELSLLRKLIKADNQDVTHDRRQQLHYYFGMTLFVSLQFLKGCPNARRMRHLHILILRRIITNMPAALYQYALALVATGQCATAMVHLNSSIIRGHLPSRALMAWLKLEGREGVDKNEDAAFELAEVGVRLGCHHCQGVMAEYLSWFNSPQWLEFAQKSSEKSSRYGQLALGELYFSGRLGVMLDYDKAVALFRLAAAQGLDMAQWRLGLMYSRGYGVAQDYTEALQLYQLAAVQGYPTALFEVAECYYWGRGVSINDAEAIRWYKRAQAVDHWGAEDRLQRLGALE